MRFYTAYSAVSVGLFSKRVVCQLVSYYCYIFRINNMRIIVWIAQNSFNTVRRQMILVNRFKMFSITSSIIFENQKQSMQLNKDADNEQDSLFPQNILIQDLHSPHYSFHHHKTSPSPPHHDEYSLHHDDQHMVISNASSNQLKFYQEFKKIYTVSYHLALQKTTQYSIIEALNKRIKNLEDKMRDGRERDTVKNEQVSEDNKTKRPRRSAEQIEKKFKCEVEFCQRFYGSEGSLQQHIKLKHPELYQKSHSEDSIVYQNNDSLL